MRLILKACLRISKVQKKDPLCLFNHAGTTLLAAILQRSNGTNLSRSWQKENFFQFLMHHIWVSFQGTSTKMHMCSELGLRQDFLAFCPTICQKHGSVRLQNRLLQLDTCKQRRRSEGDGCGKGFLPMPALQPSKTRKRHCKTYLDESRIQGLMVKGCESDVFQDSTDEKVSSRGTEESRFAT